MTNLAALSTRERQVFDMIAAGLNPAVIADRLCLSVKTVSTYRARILEKLGVRSNAELATLHCAARLSVADDHALVAAALIAGVIRWEPFSDDTRGGEVCTGGLRYPASLDDAGVPILTNLLRAAIRVAMPTSEARAA